MTMVRRVTARWRCVAVLVPWVLAGCGGSGGAGSGLPACGSGPFFTVLPVAESAIASAGPLGSLNPPSHTIPSDHAGLYVNATGVPIVVPGDMHVDAVRRSRYLVSPFRQGESDYAIYFHVCREVNGQLGHLTTLRSDLASLVSPSDCQQYSTADETVEACVTQVDVSLTAGESLGTVGGATAMAFDFGAYDSRHTNMFVNPSRFIDLTLHAVCPYELFPASLAEVMLSKVGYAGDYRTVEPRCGTMEIDVAGTAQGVWVQEGYSGQVGGDESLAIALSPANIHPDTRQVLSLGAAALGAEYVEVPIETMGRVNRLFSDVGPDGLLYCYGPDYMDTRSYFVSLDTGGVLTIEAVDHAAGASPCNDAPSTWAFDSTALRYVR